MRNSNPYYSCPHCNRGEYRLWDCDGWKEACIVDNEGRPTEECYDCDGPLRVEDFDDPITAEDIAYEKAQSSLAWERMGGGGL